MNLLDNFLKNQFVPKLDQETQDIINLGKLNIHFEKIISGINPDKKLVLFGAGSNGATILHYLKSRNISIDYFADNNKNLSSYEGLEVLHIDDLVMLKDTISIILTSMHYKAIIKQFCEVGLIDNLLGILYSVHLYDSEFVYSNTDNIIRLFDCLEDQKSKNVLSSILLHRLTCDYAPINSVCEENQYFDDNIYKFEDNECFIDGGAFDGDTIKQFIKLTSNKFDKIFAFEPDESNYEKLTDFVKSIDDGRIFTQQSGLYSEDSQIGFDMDSGIASQINENSQNVINVTKLDNYKEENITFIKMDIEGSETKALLGAEELIKLKRPKLAISVYHNPEDLWAIPLYIKSIVPEYKIYLRHYMPICAETVCYAVL